MSKLLGIDRDEGVETRYHKTSDGLVIERVQDVEPILEANKAQFNQHSDAPRRFGSKTMHKVATIPNVVIEQWMKEGVNIFDRNHAEAVLRKINDPQYMYLRTRPGRL
jgi:hypothetical protein